MTGNLTSFTVSKIQYFTIKSIFSKPVLQISVEKKSDHFRRKMSESDRQEIEMESFVFLRKKKKEKKNFLN